MASSSFASTAPFTSSEPQPRHSFPLPCCSATAQSQTAELAPPNSPKCLNNLSSTCQRQQQQQQQQRVPMPAGNRIATFGPPAGGNSSSSNIGNQRRLLKSRAQSDLVPLIKAGLRLSRQDPGIRRLMAQQGNSNGSSSSKQSASPAASSTFLAGKKLSGLGPIQEQATFDEGVDPLQLLPDLQGDLLEMRSRSGTVDSAGSSARRRRARGVSVSESEIIRVLAGGCDNCHSLLLIHNATSKPRVSNITFSTVTSATGLPTIAAEPSRPRSSSYWKPTASAAAATHSQQQQHHVVSNVGTGQSSSSVTSASASSTSHEQNKEQPTVENYNNTEHRPTVDANNFERGQSSTAGTLRSADQQVTGSNTTGAKVVAAAVEGAPPLSDKVVGGGAIRPQQKVHDIQATVAARIEAAGSNNDGTKSHRMTGQSRSGFFPTNVAGGIADAQPKPTVVPSSLPQQQQQQSTVLANDQQQSTNVPSASSAHRPTSNNKKAAATPAAPMLLEEECCSSEHSSSSSSSTGADHSLAPAVYKTVDGTHFDREELERDPALRQIQEWSFPIFRFADKHKTTVLSRLTYAIFKEAHLFRTFKISHAKFFNYFHALESGYWDIPYHNRIHAADVLHGCYYLTCHPVHAFGGYHSEMDDEEEDEDEEEAGTHSDHCDEHCADDESTTHQHQNHAEMSAAAALPLAQSMSALELMALYTAAAMHDYDHPGRTNAFLVASEDRKAILYNDRSVLENHHAAESWRLLTSQTQNHFIENLDSAETKRFRYLVLEYILATDLKQHFDIIMQFNERAPEMDLSSESDRVLVSLMLIKFADINSPAKPYQLHRQWTERICQEFYEQGDEEKVRHMAISPYMDRQEPAVSKLQDSFIAHIVNPLAVALNEAGLLPVLPGLPESELIINLKHNHQKWLQQIEVDQQQQQQQKVDRKKEIDGQQQQQRLAIEQKKNREENNESSTQQPPLEENNNKINGEGSPPRVSQSNNLPTKAHTNVVTNSHHQQPRKGSSPRLGSGRTAMATSDSRQTMPNRTNGGKVVTGSPVRMAKKEQPMTATTKATPTTCMTTVSPSSVTSPSSSSKVTSNNCNRGSTPTTSASATAADRRSSPNSRRIDTSSTSLATTTAMPSPSPTAVVSASAKTTR